MPRHGRKFCLICNPDGNGMTGEQGTEAVGVYYLQRESKNQANTGYIPVCEFCAEMTEKYFRVERFDGTKTERLTDNKDPRINAGEYVHEWHKQNLVTLDVEGKFVDHLICSKCGAEGYYFIMAPEYGCSIPTDGGCLGSKQ